MTHFTLLHTLTVILLSLVVIAAPFVVIWYVSARQTKKEKEQKAFDIRLKQLQCFFEFAIDSHWDGNLMDATDELRNTPCANKSWNREKIETLEQNYLRKIKEISN